MKKLSKLLFSVTALIVSAFAISGNNSSYLSGVEESSTNDVSKRLAVKLAQIDTEGEVSVSKTYTQRGEDGAGNQYLRYVTAVKGDVKGLQYVRNCFDLEESKQTATKSVTTVYKGVMADGEVKYYNGTDFDTNPNTDYYLACYQIKIKPESYETFKHHKWEVSLQVDTDGDISTIEHATDYRTGILEKLTPEITFNNPTTSLSFYSTDLDWMYNVPSDADYVVTYDCGDKGIFGATTPVNNGSGWAQVVKVIENDIYNAASAYSPWFFYKGETNVEIRGFGGEEYCASVADASDRTYAMDGNPDTFLWVKRPEREDAFIEWTLDEPVDIKNIKILLGKDSDGNDLFYSTLSVSKDKKTYTTIGNLNKIENNFYASNSDLNGIKYIRLTNNGSPAWVAVREIIINAEDKVFSNVSYGGFKGIHEGEFDDLYDNNPDTFVRFIKPEDSTPTRYIDLELTNATDIYAIELLNGDNVGGDLIEGHIEVSTDGEYYEQFGNRFSQEKLIIETGDAKNIKFIRVISETNNSYKAIREVRINENVESIFTNNVTIGDFVNYGEGVLSNLYDGNTETYVRFEPDYSKPDRHVKFELAKPMTIYNIQILNGDKNLGDLFSGRVLVSSDDVEYVQFGDIFEKQAVVNLEDSVTNVKYIKITSEHQDHWSALRDVKINTNNGVVKSVTNGTVHENYKSSYALDGDVNTFAWYNPASSPSVFAIEYDFFKVQDINSIMILMGNANSPRDLLYNMTFYYSTDGESYTKINEAEETEVSMNYLYRFNETVQARYIKVESNRPADLSNWIVIREFQVGMDLKLDPTITFNVEASAELTPGSKATCTVNDEVEYSVYFESAEGVRIEYNDGTVPSEAGYYSLVVDVPGNDKYKSAHVWVTFIVVEAVAE